MNPFQFAVANVKKKAQELFNNSAPVQGARMYGQAFQSPAVQKFASNAGNYLNQGLQQVSRQPLYNIPNSPTYGQLGNTLKGYATNQVIKPIVEGSFQYNKPNATLLDKGSGFLKAGMGVMNATPRGVGYNLLFNPTAGAAQAIRTKQPLQKGIEKGLTTQMSLGSEGLGIKNPLLAGAVDLIAGIKTYDPYHAGSLKGVAALEKSVSKVKGNVLHSDDIQEIVNMTKRLRGGWKDARGMVNLEQLGKDTNLADIILTDKYKVPATELKKMDITDKIRKLERIAAEDFRQNPSIKLRGADLSTKLPKSLPKELEGLAAEARKYNSAEEFGQSLLYHGTDSKNTASILNKGLIGSKGRYGSKGSIYVSTTDNPTLANYFGDDVIALKKEGLKFLDIKDYARPKYIGRLKDVPEDIRPFIAEIQGSQQGELALGSPAFQKFLKSKGYNGIVMDTADALQKEGVSFGREYRVIGNVPKENIIGSIKSPEGFVKESFSSDIYNQAKGVQSAESSIKLPVEPKIKIVNGKVKVKMKPISVPTQESLVSQSSNQGLAGSGAGGGSSIKNTKEFVNPQDPYFNVSRLNVSNKKQQAVKTVIEESKPQIEQVVGKKLSNKEVVDFSNQSAKVLNRAVNREQTKQWSASMLKAREQLAKAAHDDSLTPEFLDTLINVKSQGADIARKLQSLSINADPKTVTAKQAILEAVLKVTDNSDEILQAARGVNFNDQAQATAFYRQFVKPKAEDWLTLIRYNSMLSSPNTHIINTSSNLQGTGLVAPIEKTILGGIDWMRSKATGTSRRYYAGEGGEYAKGYYSSLAEASKNFTKVMRGEALSGNPDIRQLPLTTKKGMARTAENVLNYPMRLLEGMDQFFGTLTQAGVERSLNYRASKGVNVGNIAYKAEQEAANRLFRGEIGGKDQGTLLRAIDQVTNLVFRARSNENPIVRTIAQFTLPFVKTPMNIVKQMVEYSPAGVLTIPGAKFKQEQLAKAVMGAGVALGASQLLSSDRLTWSEPTNEKQRNAFKASGLQPYAIKIGDKWVSYAKLHPVIGFNLAMVSALNDSFKNKKLSESEVETALTGLSKWWGYFADQSYIKNMGDLVASARGDLTGTARLISNYPTQVIPFRALMSWVERLVDPYQRQADPDGSILEKQLQIIGSQIPGIAGNVPTRKNLYGEPIENQNRLINAFSPAKITTENPQQKAVYDDMVNTSIMKKQIKDMQDQAKKGNVVSGGTPTDMPSSMQMDIQEEGIKNNLKYSNKYVESIGGKLYIKQQDGSVKVISLGSSKPTGNIIQQAKQQTNKESAIKSAGVSTYFRTDMPDAEKLQVYKALGTNASDVEMKALASLDDNQQASVLYSLLKDRQWKQEKVDAFIKSDVLTNSVVSKMEQQGLINSNQATQLKNYIKSTNVKFGKTKAKKPKKLKIPKLKKISVKKTKLKIKLPKAPTAKLLKPRGGSRKYFS